MKELGEGKKIATPSSRVSKLLSLKRRCDALKGFGNEPRISAAISRTAGPEIRMIPTPPLPDGVAIAAIVSTVFILRKLWLT